MDALLLQLFEFYEIVVFTSETAINGNSLLTALDPNQLILYKLYRNSTKYVDGVHVKVCVGGAPTCVGGLLRVCGGSYVCVGAPTCVWGLLRVCVGAPTWLIIIILNLVSIC